MNPPMEWKRLRLSLGLTPEELDSRCGFLSGLTGEMESGKVQPDEVQLNRIRDVMSGLISSGYRTISSEVEMEIAEEPTPPFWGVRKNQDLLFTKIAEFWQTQRKVTKAWGFGSHARGDADSSSDIDIMIEVPPDMKFNLFDLAEIQDGIEKLTGMKADVVMQGAVRPDKMKSALNDRRLIFEA